MMVPAAVATLLLAFFDSARALTYIAPRGTPPDHELQLQHELQRERYRQLASDTELSFITLGKDASSVNAASANGSGHKNAAGADGSGHKVIWVSSYARSGSSTALSMVSASGIHKATYQGADDVFALFEPCKFNKDTYSPELSEEGCPEVLKLLANCEFDGIRDLWGWNNSHTKKPGLPHTSPYNAEQAEASCKQSSLVTFKTIGLILSDAPIWSMLHTIDNFYVVSVIRDPRGIYASEKVIFGAGGVDRLLAICSGILANHQIFHDNIISLVFEKMVTEPEKTMRQAYRQLDLEFGPMQLDWISETFNGTDCYKGVPKVMQPFVDCHSDPSDAVDSWRDVLTDEERYAFATDDSCFEVAGLYGYPKW